MSETQPSGSNEDLSVDLDTLDQADSDRALALAVYAQHDAKKRNTLSLKLTMLQKEERSLQTLLVKLRNQQSVLSIEKMRLTEAHKKFTGDNQLLDFNDNDEEDDEDEDESVDEEDNDVGFNSINTLPKSEKASSTRSNRIKLEVISEEFK